jgi:hypothetical protein
VGITVEKRELLIAFIMLIIVLCVLGSWPCEYWALDIL